MSSGTVTKKSDSGAHSGAKDHSSSTAGGGSHRAQTGEHSKTSTAGHQSGGGGASMVDQAKDTLQRLTGDVELPSASSSPVVLAILVAVPLLFWLNPDYRFLRNEAQEQEKRIYQRYHSID